MQLRPTEEIDAAVQTVLEAAALGGAPQAEIDKVRTFAKGFDVLVRAYFQGGLKQLELVFLANFPEEKARLSLQEAAQH